MGDISGDMGAPATHVCLWQAHAVVHQRCTPPPHVSRPLHNKFKLRRAPNSVVTNPSLKRTPVPPAPDRPLQTPPTQPNSSPLIPSSPAVSAGVFRTCASSLRLCSRGSVSSEKALAISRPEGRGGGRGKGVGGARGIGGVEHGWSATECMVRRGREHGLSARWDPPPPTPSPSTIPFPTSCNKAPSPHPFSPLPTASHPLLPP